ncbi:hypothetical protein HMPREF3196_01848 [Bifidobacterium bifidum]|uniref:Uncharacterized protein n=1 Tax=Bifidobacterium bifidum TaxID=1681 RepID=A0A133KL70_BIFBI|nr:hypothetical protein BIFBIF_01610 [Bifidobacterium bifidum ATCC 29521 = JCM 1255 = DSM 20456]KWZ80265.1 hypothetical protein HMPREF3196_01848 [Bifidobacterium bifidum]
MFIWSCGGLAPFLMRMICCEDGRSQDAEAPLWSIFLLILCTIS